MQTWVGQIWNLLSGPCLPAMTVPPPKRVEREAFAGQRLSDMNEPIPYHGRFPTGTTVRIENREFLEEFIVSWGFHHKLRPEQLDHADRVSTVKSVGYYHGGDPVYELDSVPGFWLEQCLRPV